MTHVNSTVVFRLEEVPNLTELAMQSNVTYNPQRFRAAIVRYCGASVLVFPNGRCVSTGRKAEHYCGHINDARIVNRVYSARIPNGIDIYRLDAENRTVFYEPEIFTGARLTFGTGTVVVFASGSYFLTGVTDDKLVAPVHEFLLKYGTNKSTTEAVVSDDDKRKHTKW